MSPEGEEMQTSARDGDVAAPPSVKSGHSTVATGALIIAAGTLLSRLLGLIRENRIAHYYGASDIAGAFRSAASIPDLLYYLLAGGALSAAFIPVFSDYLLRGKQSDTNRIGSSIMNLMTLILLVGVLLEMIFAPAIVHFAAVGYSQGAIFDLTVALTRVMCAMVIFTAISGLLTGILNSYHHFLLPTIVWNVYNLFIIFGIEVMAKMHIFGGSAAKPNLNGVAWGVLLGALAMALMQVPAVMKYGFRFEWRIDLKHPGVQRVLQLFVPVMIGLSLISYNLQFIPLQVASWTGATAVAVIYSANRIVLLPMGIFAVAIATAAFPRLSQQVTMGEESAFRDTLSSSLKAIILLILPSTVGIYLLAEPITCLLWGGGAFIPQDIKMSAYALSLFIWGLLGLSLLQVVNRAFFARKELLYPVAIGVLMVVANFFLGTYLSTTSVKYGGTALATSITTTLATLVLLEILRRRMHGIDGRNLMLTTVKAVLACVIMGGVVFLIGARLSPHIKFAQQQITISPTAEHSLTAPPYVEHSIKQGAAAQSTNEASIQTTSTEKKTVNEKNEDLHVPRLRLLLQVGISIFAGLLVYLGMLYLLGVKEVSALTDRILGRLRRRATDAPTA